MNKLSKTFIALCLAFLAGCATNTGLVFVDKTSFDRYGLSVTNFVDNQLYAHIYYDYSKVKDFDPSKIDVTLMHNVVLPEMEEALGDIQDSPDLWYSYPNAMNLAHMGLCTVDGIRITSLPDRKAIVKESLPGKLTILSFDDIGTYRITYNK